MRLNTAGGEKTSWPQQVWYMQDAAALWMPCVPSIIEQMKLEQISISTLPIWMFKLWCFNLLTRIHDALRQQQGHTGTFLVMNSLAVKHKEKRQDKDFLPGFSIPPTTSRLNDLQLKGDRILSTWTCLQAIDRTFKQVDTQIFHMKKRLGDISMYRDIYSNKIHFEAIVYINIV